MRLGFLGLSFIDFHVWDDVNSNASFSLGVELLK